MNRCKASGCVKPITTAKPSAGYCYSHLLRLAPDKCPPSMRPKARPNIRISRKGTRPGGDGKIVAVLQKKRQAIAQLQADVAVLEQAQALLLRVSRV